MTAILTVLPWLLARACWTWLSGGQWFPPERCPTRHRYNHGRRPCRCTRRRYVTRPVRATLQTGVTLVVLGLVIAPLVTAWTLAALALTLFGSAGAWRLRQHLDRRIVVLVGEPIRNPPSAASSQRRRPSATAWPRCPTSIPIS